MDVNNKILNTSNNSDVYKYETQNKINKEKINTVYNKDNNNNNNNNSNNLSISKESLDKLVTEVNHKFKLFNKELSYKIHEETKRISVEIKDSETGKVIKEIPSEESLDLSAKIKEMAGLLIDEKS